jgi:hypothetical protein
MNPPPVDALKIDPSCVMTMVDAAEDAKPVRSATLRRH